MKIVVAALAISAVAEVMVYRSALKDFSNSVSLVMFVGATVGSIVVGRFSPRLLMAFCAGVALAAPAIGYSMIGSGVLEMGGLFHAALWGGFAAASYGVSYRPRNPPTPKGGD